MIGSLARGLAAGAAGTTVLNAVTYLDMALRGRAASGTPERVVDAIAARTGRAVPGPAAVRAHRRTALGALSGIGTGVGLGVVASGLRSAGVRFSRPVGAVLTGAAAMAASDGTAAALGVTDPRTWTAADWAADAVPHLAYGAAVQAVLEAVPTERERRTPRAPAGAGLALRSAALGVASGARSSLGLSGPTLSAPAGAVPPLRRLVSLAAVAGELVADKNPATPDRTDPPALGARFLGAAVGAGRLAGRDGANGAVPVLAAAAGAAVGAFGGIGWRRWAAARIPATRAALVEDGVALLLAAVACLPGRSGTGRPRLVVVPRG